MDIEQLLSELEQCKKALQGEIILCDSLRSENKALKAENIRLQAIIDEANAQVPVRYYHINLGVDAGVYREDQITAFPSKFAPLYAAPIPAQQSPAVPDPEDSVQSIASTLHNYATHLHYAGNEKLADQLDEIVLRLWKCKPSPRITDQDAREIIIAYQRFIPGDDLITEFLDDWISASCDTGCRALLDKLNK